MLLRRLDVGIIDESGGSESADTHGLVDLAAALACNAWLETPLARVCEDLYHGFSAALPFEFDDLFGRLEFSREDSIRFGVRLGYALARTSSSTDQGWSAWLEAAERWLQSISCGTAAHQNTPREYRDEFLADLNRLREAGTWSAAKAQSGGPPPEVRSAVQTISNAIDDAVDESMAEHVRLHHADRAGPAPAQEPSTTKARPTVEQQPKRQPAGSRAAAGPPARHRAVDVGHVAAAAPSFDQCADDDLEIAGHRHPRATDPWFAEHGAA